MFERVFIAEKPKMAEAIAQALAKISGVKETKGDGAWMVGNDAVTWFFGHMYEGLEPKEYNPKWEHYTLESLPIFLTPSEWKREPVDNKKAHIAKVQRFLKNTKLIVNCGDAGSEGQLLVDEALVEMGFNPFKENVRRLWVQSFALTDMMAALRNLFPNSEKENLFMAALCRQIADYNHGMSFSRYYSILAKKSGASRGIAVGRVMTPTLRLVVDREREISNFKPVTFYTPKITFSHENGDFDARWVVPENCDGTDNEGRLVNQGFAQGIVQKVSGKTGVIADMKKEVKAVKPPLPYNLSELQNKCGAVLGLTAKEVLDVAQALYDEHKVTTYARSDSRYLSMALYEESKGVLDALSGTEAWGDIAKGANPSLRSNAWNDTEVKKSDHHAITITNEFHAGKLAALSPRELAVFKIIAESFLAQFYPDYTYQSLIAHVSCENETFRATGKKVVSMGWRSVLDDDDENTTNDKDEKTLPDMAKNDSVKHRDGVLLDDKTKPPKAFTDGSLIKAMTNAHLFETDPVIRRTLRECKGIGTEATRSGIIEKLLNTKYLARRGKTGLTATQKGFSKIDAVEPNVKSLGLTAQWDMDLSRVASGDMSADVFMEQQKKFLLSCVTGEENINRVIEIKGDEAAIRPLEGTGKTCPLCEKGKLVTRRANSGDNKGRRFLSCSESSRDGGCSFFLWDCKPIEGHGKTCKKCGKGTMATVEFNSPKGKKSGLVCTRRPECDHREIPGVITDFEPLPEEGTTCPKCKSSTLTTKAYKDKVTEKVKRYLRCRSRDCDYIDWCVQPMEGHGETCPKCNKGVMNTQEYTDKETKETKRFLKCSAECGHTKWPPRPVEPLPGHGETCGTCKKGKMMTFGFKGNKRARKCDACGAVAWENDKKS